MVRDYTALLGGSYWGGLERTGQPAFVTYSFSTKLLGYQEEFDQAGFKAFGKAERSTAKKALEAWSEVSGIKFLEVKPGQGDIAFGMLDFREVPGFEEGYAGFAYLPQPEQQHTLWAGDIGAVPDAFGALGGDVFLDIREQRSASDGGFHYLLHEIGHAIGLKHPFEENWVHDDILADDLDRAANTVMSYNFEADFSDGIGRLDVDAVRHIYGKPGGLGKYVSDWSWDARKQVLTLAGFAKDDVLTGTSASDRIDGGKGNDFLAGLAGDDRLTGGSGDDRLNAGAGDDLLRGDGGSNTLLGGEGRDTVTYADARSGIEMWDGTITGEGIDDYVSEVENFVGSRFADLLSGRDVQNLVNRLDGGAGDDVLKGGEGDRLVGGKGFDTADYYLEGEGIGISLETGSGWRGIAKGSSFSSIEGLVGSSSDDRLVGNGSDNRIDGSTGRDIIDGRGGMDRLKGGSEADRFLFSTTPGSKNLDVIEDFDASEDMFQLDRAVFSAFAKAGAMAAAAFKDLALGKADADDRILYSSKFGNLYYDADGSGLDDAMVRVAKLEGAPKLESADFTIV